MDALRRHWRRQGAGACAGRARVSVAALAVVAFTGGCGGGQADPADLSKAPSVSMSPPASPPVVIETSDGAIRVEFDTSEVSGAADDPAVRAYAAFTAAVNESFNRGRPTEEFLRVTSPAARQRYAPIIAEGGPGSGFEIGTDLRGRLESVARTGGGPTTLVTCLWRPSTVYVNKADGSPAENADPVWDRFTVSMVRIDERWVMERDVKGTGGEATCDASAPS